LPFVSEVKSMAPSHTSNGLSLLDHHKTKTREVATAGMVIPVVVGVFWSVEEPTALPLFTPRTPERKTG
jgi:hypothetical protein